jgi:hypothetical protein
MRTTVLSATEVFQPGTMQHVHLGGGEHQWLNRQTQTVRVVSGTAWISYNREDVIINEGQSVRLRSSQFSSLIGGLNAQPIDYMVISDSTNQLSDERMNSNSFQTDDVNNPDLLHDYSWPWLIRLDGNQLANTEFSSNWRLRDLIIPASGMVVRLLDYGIAKVFRMDGIDGQPEYWATSKLDMAVEEAAFRRLDL